MKKTLLIFFYSVLMLSKTQAQCVIVPISLQDRVNQASLIVEAQVANKTTEWNQDGSLIITKNQLNISKIYKGAELINGSSINLTTLGGTIGLKSLKVSPELELESGAIGIFLLIQKDGEWVSESGEQGFIEIDKHTAKATDIFNLYPAFSIQNTIESLTKTKVILINEWLTKIQISAKRAAPTITSFTPTTITSGTSSILTIKGTNFKTLRDTNSVQFANADKGGSSFTKAWKNDYISWSDTMIRLKVLTQAGTGKIRVVVGGNGVVNSSQNLTVSYAHLNITNGDTIARENQLIGLNSSKGITWKFNQTFYTNNGAKDAFVRSLERWRCGSFVNWDTLGTIPHSAIKKDNINVCAWDTNSSMPSGVLAQCFSWYAGCFNPGLTWYTDEMDIRFRIKPSTATNWNYSTSTASGSEYHFESVATHEIGHGHQLGHVIESSVVMHYSIGNGQVKPTLSTNDIACGTYIINKSSSSTCGKPFHQKLNSSNCSFVAPVSYFTFNKTLPCVGVKTTFTDSSTGNITDYLWNFGAGASPSSANTKGPHNVSYSFGGTKAVKLSITTSSGVTQNTRNFAVSVDTLSNASFNYIYAGSNNVGFINQSIGSGNTYKWYFGDGDSSSLKNPNHQYVSANNKSVKLKVSGRCNTDDTTIILRNFTAISDNQYQNLFKIVPNPASNIIMIMSPINDLVELKIIDCNGKCIETKQQLTNDKLTLNGLSQGIYFIRMTYKGYILNYKLMVE